MRSWRAWSTIVGVWSLGLVGCTGDVAPGPETRLAAVCAEAGGDYYDRDPALLCVFGARQGVEVGPGFECPAAFPNRVGDPGLTYCNASTEFPVSVLMEIEARYPEDVEDAGDVGPDGGEAEDVGPAPVGESCAEPRELSFEGGQVEVVADTRGAREDAASLCDGSAGADHVYAVTLEEAGDLVWEVEALDGEFVPALFVREVCEQRVSQLPGACARHRARPGKNAVVAVSAEPGTYYVWVASPGQERGAYRLRGRFSARAAAQAAPSCEALPGVELDPGASLGLGVSARGQIGAQAALCEHQAWGVTRVGVEVAEAGLVTVELLREAGPGFVAGVRPECGGDEEAFCGNIITGEERRVVMQERVSAGVAEVVLGGLEQASLPGFELEVRHGGVSVGESCQAPGRLVQGEADESGVREVGVVASLQGYQDGHAAACGVNGRDRVWELTLDEPSDVMLEIQGEAAAQLSVSLGSACEEVNHCEVGRLERGGLPAGTYYVRVDGDMDDPAEFTLRARVRPTLIGGSCESPGTAIALRAGESTVVALDAGDVPSAMVRCAPGPARDRMVTLEVLEPGDLALSTATLSAGATWWAELATECRESGGCLEQPRGMAGLEAGEHALKVASDAGEALTVQVALLPPGDRCFGAEPLALNQLHNVSLAGYHGEGAPSCAGEAPVADRAFEFTLSEATTVMLTLTPVSGTDRATLWLERGGCGQALELRCEEPSAGQPASLVLGALTAGTYRVWAGGNPGDYTLDITTH
ncbi:hypothetical protein DL240_02460 [Lujinxingia litoralis]|uniref:Uncharacterized protein n=1 Tax=Lujinxingia litoralis TaxID=2211119 RepID=A0A328CBQ1_9DELT|nr:hypothetical protein [Lujinxingia litoralis]RAL25096.1 hypothetical protein DL240_02460 [Lujinxingia litoralis]